MEQLIAIVSLVFGVLSIILFFKIWGMTNDVKAIREKLASATEFPTPVVPPSKVPQTGASVFCKSMNEKGIFKGMVNGQAEIEFSDGGVSYLPLYDIEPLND